MMTDILRYRTSKRPSRILKQVHIGDWWRYKKTGELFQIKDIIPSTRHKGAYYIIMHTNWILPPRYFWDLMEKVNDDISPV